MAKLIEADPQVRDLTKKFSSLPSRELPQRSDICTPRYLSPKLLDANVNENTSEPRQKMVRSFSATGLTNNGLKPWSFNDVVSRQSAVGYGDEMV